MAKDLEKLRDLLLAGPFASFDLALSDGTTLPARRRFQLLLSPRRDRIVYADDRTGRFERRASSDIVGWQALLGVEER